MTADESAALSYSSIVSIVYFSVNVVFMMAIAIMVYKQGQHEVKSKSYLKDIWSQRKIYAPLIVHFYDTATDIGVIYNWNELMKAEHDPAVNFVSVDMNVFFWFGILFLIIYRLCLLVYVMYELYDGDGDWYDLILVLLDLYILKVVYESFQAAQGIITANAKKRAANIQRKLQIKREEEKEEEKSIETMYKKQEEVEIEPVDTQKYLQIGESITESMPQIILQSVFIIRSANDDQLLENGANIILLLLSVIASLLSISNKFVIFDKDDGNIQEHASKLKLRMESPYVNKWYIIRVLWRLCHIMSRFAVLVLIWTVLGGAWFSMWILCSLLYWTVLNAMDETPHDIGGLFGVIVISIIFIVAVIDGKEYIHNYAFKFIETLIGVMLITIFGLLQFESENRKLYNERLLIFWSLALGSYVLEVVLFFILYFADIFK